MSSSYESEPGETVQVASNMSSALQRLQDMASTGSRARAFSSSSCHHQPQASFSLATKETNSGLKRSRKASTTSSSKAEGKRKASTSTKAKTKPNPNFAVLAVVILPNGVQKKQTRTRKSIGSELDEKGGSDEGLDSEAESDDEPTFKLPSQQDAFPTNLIIQEMQVKGLAVVDYHSGIQFSKNWTFEQVQAHLSELFPGIFEYFDTMGEDKNYDKGSAGEHPYKSRWMLCTKAKRKAELVPGIPYPTGIDLFHWSGGGQRSGFSERVIILTTRHLILKSEIKRIGRGKAMIRSMPAASVNPTPQVQLLSLDEDDDETWIDTSDAFKPSSPPRPSTPKKSKGKRKNSSPLIVRGSSDEENTSPSPIKKRRKVSCSNANIRAPGPSRLTSTFDDAPFTQGAIDLTNIDNTAPTPAASPVHTPKPLSFSKSISFAVDSSIPNIWAAGHSYTLN